MRERSEPRQWPRPIPEAAPPRVPALPAQAELLEWFDASTSKPLPSVQVLLWIAFRDGTAAWEAGWWDSDGQWLLCESGGRVDGTVLFYADPEGPPQGVEVGRLLYRVVDEEHARDLEEAVQLMLDGGWQLSGGVFAVQYGEDRYLWAQALTRMDYAPGESEG